MNPDDLQRIDQFQELVQGLEVGGARRDSFARAEAGRDELSSMLDMVAMLSERRGTAPPDINERLVRAKERVMASMVPPVASVQPVTPAGPAATTAPPASRPALRQPPRSSSSRTSCA